MGTEGIAVMVTSAGYALEEVVLEVKGLDGGGNELFAVQKSVEELPRGREVRVEVPSYDVPADPKELTVTLVSGELGESQ